MAGDVKGKGKATFDPLEGSLDGPPLLAQETGPRSIKCIQFGVLSPQEIVALSEFEAVQPAYYEYDESGKRNTRSGGVLDRRMGPTEKKAKCLTCLRDQMECVGHWSYVRLAVPVFHLGYFKQTIMMLQNICKSCSRILLPEEQRRKYLDKLRKPHLDNQTRQRLAKEINAICRKPAASSCLHCGALNGQVKKAAVLRIQHDRFHHKKAQGSKEMWLESFGPGLDKTTLNALQKTTEDLNALKVLSLFRRVIASDCELLGLDPQVCRPEEFLWQFLAVPPNCIRPSVLRDDGGTGEDSLTQMLAEIIGANQTIKMSLLKGEPMTLVANQWEWLALCVAMYINSEIIIPPTTANFKDQKKYKGFYQRLKGKQGRFRGNLSGKRVDFSGRTVISPDPNLRIDEVAVPERIAKILTYPERVTSHNIGRLRQAVINGQDIHPGATIYYNQSEGKKFFLKAKPELRQTWADSLQIGDIVDRHLVDNDVVLFNRQPSLHKLSIMSHRVKVRPWRTFRLNECVCTPYNADFDGDEMNLHVPQTEEARTEAAELMNIKQNLVTPRNGEPIIAATQDFITASFLLSRKDSFFNRQQLSQLLSYLDDASTHYDIPPPAIVKPVRLWTGKQIFSLLLRPNNQSNVLVNLQTKNRTCIAPPAPYSLEMSPNDGYLVIYNSEVMCGLMDKATVGDGKKDSVFGVIMRDYGPDEAAKAMNRMAKLSARWFSNRGFSIGISDVTPSDQLQRDKESLIETAYGEANKTINLSRSGKLARDPGCNDEQTLEAHLLGQLSRVRETLGNLCLEDLSVDNAPLIMATCGSKGSKINVAQMVACVGQQAISGARVPDGFQDRSLPHFPKFSKEPSAKGFVKNSFFSGLSATEFLFHAISGREGLVDTAVKTAETGYMQRRLMKALEDLATRYDNSVRNSVGGVVQFTYGDDGLDPVSLEGEHVPVNFVRSWSHARATSPLSADPIGLLPHEIQTYVNKVISNSRDMEWRTVHDSFKKSVAKFVVDSVVNVAAAYRKAYGLPEALAAGDNLDDEGSMAVELPEDQRVDIDAVVRNKTHVTKLMLDTFLKLCLRKYLRAKIEPGTAVGAVGAQSIGEPGTQMTLKTFHFAGVASMNVTLGVPRIREIINASKVIGTPIITAVLDQDAAKRAKDWESLDNGAQTQRMEASARVVKGRIEKTYLRDITSIIAPTFEGEHIWLNVHIDMQTIERLHLELTLENIKKAIEAAKLPGMESVGIKKQAGKLLPVLRVFPKQDGTRWPLQERKANKPFDDFSRLQALQRVLPDVVIKGIKECTRAVIKKSETSGEMELLVEGNGLREVMATDGVIGIRTTSNHIMEVEKVLGIEAARATIIKQIAFTMGSHGLSVDPRHTMLLGDVMTFKGEVLGINRFGVAKLKDSVLMLASFEKTTDHLFEGAFYGKRDTVNGISERIILGQPADHVGTSIATLVSNKPLLEPLPKMAFESMLPGLR